MTLGKVMHCGLIGGVFGVDAYSVDDVIGGILRCLS